VTVAGRVSKSKWLLFLDSMSSLEDFFTDIYIPLDCEFLVAQRSNGTEEGDLEVSLREVYNVHPTRPLQIYTVAKWISNSGLTYSEVSFLERRADLHGISLKTAVFNDIYNKFYSLLGLSASLGVRSIPTFRCPSRSSSSGYTTYNQRGW